MKTNKRNMSKTFLDSQDLKKITESPEQMGTQTIEFIGTDAYVEQMNQSIRRQVMGIPRRCANASNIIEEIRHGLADNSLNGDDLFRVAVFGREFYSDYYVSPGTVVQCLGYDLTLRTFRALAPLWNLLGEPNETEFLDSLGDPSVVYRTGNGSVGSVAKGIRWTRKDMAEWNHKHTPCSILIQAEVPKAGVLAITPDLEVIVDPEKITRVELLEDHFNRD